MKRSFVVALLCLGFVSKSIAHAERKAAGDPVELIRRATELMDVWTTGALRLRMRVKFLAVKSGTIDATYERVSASWQQWRTTISSSDFNAITVGGEGKVWEWSDASEKPLRVWQLERALAGLSQYPIGKGPEYSIRYRQFEPHRDKRPCVQVQDGRRLIQDCINPDSGTLEVFQEESWVYFYSDYKLFGGKLYPHMITVTEAYKPVVVAQVVELESLQTIDPKLFEPPASSEVHPVCKEGLGVPLGASGGKQLTDVSPISPQLPSNSGIMSNDMSVESVLGRDGKLRYVHPGGTNHLTAEATLEAVRRWQFEPFTVCGFAVEMPVGFTMNFDKSGRFIGHIGP